MWLRILRGYYEVSHALRYEVGLEHLSEADALAERTRSELGRVGSIVFSTMAYAALGSCERAEAKLRELGRTGITGWAAWGSLYLAWAWLWKGRYREAINQLRALLDRSDPFVVGTARASLSEALAEAGEIEFAPSWSTGLFDGDSPFADKRYPVTLSALAVVALRHERPADALECAEQGLDARPRIGTRLHDSNLRLLRARALHDLHRFEEARAAIGEARDALVREARSIGNAELRDCYLNKVGSVRTLELARQWLGGGTSSA
jgi:tetratricopeptide (TPR) repeat protein